MGFDRPHTLIDLIRHGEPEGGPMFRGSKDDPLSALGWQQMRGAIRNEDHWDVIVTSPLSRCAEFAREVSEQRDIPWHVEPRLKELHFGDWEGLTARQVLEDDGERLKQFWQNATATTPPNGESMADFQQRILAAWADWTRELSGQRALVVCHGGVIRLVVGHLLGVPLERTFSALAVEYASRSRIRLDESDHGLLACLLEHGVMGG